MLQRYSDVSSFEPTEPDSEQGFDPHEVLNFLWREWKLIAVVVFVSVLIGMISFLQETPLYTSSAQILLEPRKDKLPGTEAPSGDSNLDLSGIESQISIIRSSALLKRVVQREHLVTDPEFGNGPSPRPFSIFSLMRWPFSSSNASGDTSESSQTSEPSESEITSSVEALKGAVSVSRSGQANVLYITVSSVDSQRAARLANAIAEAYTVDKLDARYEAAKNASTWLGDRLVELRNKLRDSEEAVVKFRSEHGLQQVNTSTTLSQQQLADLNAKLIAAKTDAAEKLARMDLLKSLETQGTAQNLPADLANFGILQSLRQQEAVISQKEADLASRYSAQYPLLVNVRAEHRDVKRAIVAEIHRLAASVKSDYDLAKARQDAIENSIQGVTGQAGADNDMTITLRDLERTAAVNKSLYEDFLKGAKITDAQSTFEPREVRVLSPALPPGGPSSPRLSRKLMMSLIIGLFLGVGGAYAKEKLNTGFTTPRQIESTLGLPLLSSIGRIEAEDRKVDGKVVAIPLIPLFKPLSRHSEMMRALRLGIQMTDVDDPPKVIQITSTMPGEGKTTVSLALAASAASSGMKVLFIDADLRNPRATRLLKLQDQPGLVDMLVSRADVQDLIKYNERAQIWILPAGSPTQNPSDLLASDLLKTRIGNFKSTFDYIVIDTAPLAAVIDPIVTASLADKVVLVVRWAATARNLVKHTVRQLPGHKRIAGVVFNMVDEHEAQKYAAYLPRQYGSAPGVQKYYTE